MTDINLSMVQPATASTPSKSKTTDVAAGDGIAPRARSYEAPRARPLAVPATEENLVRALSAFDVEELPPIPQEKDLHRTTPSSEQLLSKARLLLDHGDKKNAAHLVRQALAIHAANPVAMKLMIETLGEGEFAAKERMQLRRALTRYQPNFENFFELAKLYYVQGDLEIAARNIEHAFCFPTENARHLFEANKTIGNIETQRGDFDAAEEFYHKAFALDPRNSSLLVNLGTLEVQRRDYQRAGERFHEALQIARGVDAENHVRALVGLFLVARELEGPEACASYLQEALQVSPSNRTAVHLFAHFSHQRALHTAAIPVLESYLDEHGFDEEMSLVATQFYCLQGQFEEALLEAEKTALWNPANGEAVQIIEQINDFRKSA